MTSSTSRQPDWAAVRRDFPILDQQIGGHPLIYFDNAATSQKPQAVIDAISLYYTRDNSNVHRGLHALSNRATAAFEDARAAVARYLGGHEAEVVFTRGTTEAINLVARAWGDARVAKGDVLLLTEMEHHSNLVPWQLLAQRRGASLRFIPLDPDGNLDLAGLDNLLEGPVRLLAFTHVSNSLGTINPAAELCRRARAAGVTVLVDAAQSIAHFPLDVRELGADFVVFSGHKMCGPTGIGVLWGRNEMLDALPPFLGGGEMIANAWYEESTYKESPYRFEAGTPPIAEAIGLGAAVRYIEELGRSAIAAREVELVTRALDVLDSLPGIRILGPRNGRGPLVSFVIEGAHAHDIVTLADQYGLALRGGHHCTQPLLRKLGVPSSARASFAFYNTPEEVDAMGGILRKVLRLLA
jgi:cysteine desulfurase/selenocysteine lyase